MAQDSTPLPEGSFSATPLPPPAANKPPARESPSSAIIAAVRIFFVVGVLGGFGMLGMGLLLPTIERVRYTSDRFTSACRISQIALGAHAAHDEHKRLPPGIGIYGPENGMKNGTVLYHLLPFVEQQGIWNLGPEGAAKEVVSTYLSPLDNSAPDGTRNGKGASNFAGNDQIFGKASMRLKDIRAGTSNVILFATVPVNCGFGGGHTHSDPNEPPLLCNNYPTFAPPHIQRTAAALTPSGVQVAMGDRSVRYVAPSVSLGTWLLVMNPTAPQAPGPDWAE